MTLDFSGQTVIVTGAGRGIGRACAEAFWQAGAQVIVTSTGDAPSWMKECRQRMSHRTVDFSHEDRLEAFAHEIAKMPRLDVLVNNAGFNAPKRIAELVMTEADTMTAVNLMAPLWLSKAAAGVMSRAHGGRIVNLASIAGIMTRPGNTIYAMTKAGLMSLTRSFAVEYGEAGILVNAVCPGYTDTDLLRGAANPLQQEALRATVPLGRFLQPDEVAPWVLFLASKHNTYITGQSIFVDGGVSIK